MIKNRCMFFLSFLIMVVLVFIIGFFVIPEEESYALEVKIDPSTWSYVDGLGRTGLVNVNRNDEKKRLVGVFYWPSHLELNFFGPHNVNNIIKENPTRINDWAWWNENFTHGGYWWNESIYGYYMEDDDYVLRKQAELLADAGVDFVVFDCTNGSYTWELGYENLLKVWFEAMNDGVDVPKVSFMLPFSYSDDTSGVSFMTIYNDLYDENSDNYKKYKDLLFYYNDKPFILMAGYEKASAEIKNILSKFEIRENYPYYFATGAQDFGSWGWLSTYPQAYYKKKNGDVEQITVGVSQNANYVTNELTAMNGENVMGRSYAKGDYFYTYKYRNKLINVGSTISGDSALYNNTSLYGRNFQQQWDYAHEIDPEIVFVTGWNEWTMGRHENWSGVVNAFPDQFNDEYSRDVEPSKGELKDYYYYQLVNNIRKFKGTTTQPAQEKTVTINKLSDWDNSNIFSYNHYVGGKNRLAVGYGLTYPFTYINNTFRNDIKTAKVSYDKSYMYFYVETVNDLTSSSDNNWMRLLIDTVESTSNESTENWEEFEYIVNRNVASDNTMVLEKSVGGWNFEVVGNVEYDVDGNILQIKIPRSYLGLIDKEISFNFKWCDNNLDSGDIMSLYTNGDSAPGGRFAFHFSGSSEYVEDINIEIKDYNYNEESNIISNIPIGITKNEYLSKFVLDNSYVVEFDIDSEYVNTGSKIKIYKDDVLIKELTNVVVGDTNGDGYLSIFDIVKINNHIIDNNKKLSNIFALAGDLNKDGTLSVFDIVKINNLLIGIN